MYTSPDCVSVSINSRLAQDQIPSNSATSEESKKSESPGLASATGSKGSFTKPKPPVPSYKLHGSAAKKDEAWHNDVDGSPKTPSAKPPVPSYKIQSSSPKRDDVQQNGNGVSPNQSPTIGKWKIPLRKTRNTGSDSAVSDDSSTQ